MLEEEKDAGETPCDWLFLLILIYILCLWLALLPPYRGRPAPLEQDGGTIGIISDVLLSP